MLKAVGPNEIEQILAVTDAIGISREAIVIPLRTENPGRLKMIAGGKLEIVVDRDVEFSEWLRNLEARIRELMNRQED